MKQRVIHLLVFVGMFFLLTASLSRAGELTNEIRTAIDKGFEILKESTPGEDGKEDKIAQLKELVYPLFNFNEMARRSLGRHWRQRTPEEQKEFVGVFTDFLEMTYAGKIDFYQGWRGDLSP